MFETSLQAGLAARDGAFENAGIVMFAYSARTMRLCDFAAMTWVIYDWFYTLEDEIKYIWGSANTPPKILYVISRYLGLIIVIPPAAGIFPFYCYPRLTFTSITYHLLNYIVEFSLMIRVYALWGQGRQVAIALLLVFALTELANLTMVVKGMTIMKSIIFPAPGSMKGCVELYLPTIWHYSWVPVLFFETLMFVLSCIRCMPHWSLPDAPLVTRVFRDGAAYYLCMLLFFLLFTIGMLAGDVVPYLDAFVASVLSIASSHLLLSIRAYVHASEQASAITSIPLDFATGDLAFHELSVRQRSIATSTNQTISPQNAVSSVLRYDAEDGAGNTTLSFNTLNGDLEVAAPTPAAVDDPTLTHTWRSRRFNGLSEWIVAS